MSQELPVDESTRLVARLASSNRGRRKKKKLLSNDLPVVHATWDSYDKPEVRAPGQRLRERVASAHVAGNRENRSLKAPFKLGPSAYRAQLPPRAAGLLNHCLVHPFLKRSCVDHPGLKPQSQSLE